MPRITIQIEDNGNGSDVDLFINDEWCHTFDGVQTAVESLKLPHWQHRIKAIDPNYIAPNVPCGIKTFSVIHSVGKTKYVVNYHDGVKSHDDGSKFYDIRVFRKKASMVEFVNELKSQGYEPQ